MKENMIFNYNKFQFRRGIVEKIINIMDKQEHVQGGTLFIGDSIVEMIPEGFDIINNGIGGLTSEVLEYLIDELAIKFSPEKIYIHIGTNDLGETSLTSPREIAMTQSRIITTLMKNLPGVKVTLISTLPCLDTFQGEVLGKRGIRSNRLLHILNEEQQYFLPEGAYYLDLGQYLINDDGSIKEEYYEDQLHLNPSGYAYLRQFI